MKRVGAVILVLILLTISVLIVYAQPQEKESDCGMAVDEWVSFLLPTQKNTCERLGGNFALLNFYDGDLETPIVVPFCVKEVEAIK